MGPSPTIAIRPEMEALATGEGSCREACNLAISADLLRVLTGGWVRGSCPGIRPPQQAGTRCMFVKQKDLNEAWF